MAANEAKVAACKAIIHYEFQNELRCLEALLAARQPLFWHGGLVTIEKNDRLAVLGDSVVKT